MILCELSIYETNYVKLKKKKYVAHDFHWQAIFNYRDVFNIK